MHIPCSTNSVNEPSSRIWVHYSTSSSLLNAASTTYVESYNEPVLCHVVPPYTAQLVIAAVIFGRHCRPARCRRNNRRWRSSASSRPKAENTGTDCHRLPSFPLRILATISGRTMQWSTKECMARQTEPMSSHIDWLVVGSHCTIASHLAHSCMQFSYG